MRDKSTVLQAVALLFGTITGIAGALLSLPVFIGLGLALALAAVVARLAPSYRRGPAPEIKPEATASPILRA